MKLYLSSYRIPDLRVFENFVGKEASKTKFALVLNSKDYKTSEERAQKRDELITYFSGLGFVVEELNLLDYVGGEGLLEKLKAYDVVWLNGGNTFCLRWALRECNGEKILREALEGGIVYGGDSAGAIVVGPTLKHFDNVDSPSVAKEVIYEGLGFIDFVILPHWNSPEYGEILQDTRAALEKEGYTTKELNDSQCLLIEQ